MNNHLPMHVYVMNWSLWIFQMYFLILKALVNWSTDPVEGIWSTTYMNYNKRRQLRYILLHSDMTVV